MKLIIVLCIFSLLVMFLIISYVHILSDLNSLLYGLYSFNSEELCGFPTSEQNLEHIRQILIGEKIDTKKLTFIDFGCGEGDVLLKYKDDFKQIIGIELNKKLAKKAKNRLNKKAKILNIDMINYEFDHIPTLFYMYEPLWCVEYDDAKRIYETTIKNLIKIKSSPVYIVYLTGITRHDLSLSFFEEYGFELMKKQKLGFYPYRCVYVMKKFNQC